MRRYAIAVYAVTGPIRPTVWQPQVGVLTETAKHSITKTIPTITYM